MADIDTEWLENMKPAFLECRTLRHVWHIWQYDTIEGYNGRRVDRKAMVLRRDMHCTRCDTTRYDFFEYGSSFRRLTSRYVYPKGYKFLKSKNRPERPAFDDYNRTLYEKYWT